MSNELYKGKGEIERWITSNGQHISVEKGEDGEEAVVEFNKDHENKPNNAQKEKDGQIDNQEQNGENSPKLDKNTPPPDEEAEELKKIVEEKKKQEVEAELERRWQETWSKLNPKQKRQAIKLLNTQAIQFDIGDKVLNIVFNKITIGKNLKRRFNSDVLGFWWKKKNIDKFAETLKNLKFDHSDKELGKDDPSHYGVKDWHYLVGEFTSEDITFEIVANIADKGEEQFLYELTMNVKNFENKK